MMSRGGASVVGGILLIAALSGCATATNGASSSAAPSLGPAPTSTPTVAAPSSDEVAEAQQRADAWLATTPMPPDATRVDSSPNNRFAQSWQGWVCTPTAEATGYWTIADMTPTEVMNWMIEHPTPGLVLTRTEPVPVGDSMDGALMGATPPDTPLEGIAFTYLANDSGTAVRAEVGAVPASASCPSPPGGGTWGRPGEG